MPVHTLAAHDHIIRILVSGDIDLDACDLLHEQLLAAIAASPAAIEVDLRDVRLCDTGAVGTLTHAHRMASAQHVDLYVTHPQAPVQRLLAATGVLPELTAPTPAVADRTRTPERSP